MNNRTRMMQKVVELLDNSNFHPYNKTSDEIPSPRMKKITV